WSECGVIGVWWGGGAEVVGLVGTNIGAGEHKRALRIAFVGGATAFAITSAIGIAAALWPQAWLGLFSTDPRVIETGSAYLRLVRPFYRFFRLWLPPSLSSPGAGRLFRPLTPGVLRILVPRR